MNENCNIDLNIENYELEDILSLFRIPEDFNEYDLKNAKKIVLKTHPDKSGLSPEYFRFYSRAYKSLFAIWEFKNKNLDRSNENIDEEVHKNKINMTKSEKKTLDNVLNNDKMKDPKHFNRWFNEKFEKTKVSLEEEEHGYGNWLQSNEDLNENHQMTIQDFDKKKEELRSKAMILKRHVTEISSMNSSFTNLTGEVPDSYSSGLFSSLNYEDLRKAHTETIIPVTMEDYENIPKYKSVNEYQQYRETQNTTPYSIQQAKEYLNNKNQIEDKDTTLRAYKLAKQSEDVMKKQHQFWGNLYKLEN